MKGGGRGKLLVRWVGESLKQVYQCHDNVTKVN